MVSDTAKHLGRWLVLFGLTAVFVVGAFAAQEDKQERPVPRLGRYTVILFSGFTRTPSFFHYLDLLPGGKYRVSNFNDKVQSEGTFELDENKDINWLTGLYKEEKGYFGKFQVKGAVHEIRLKGTLYARNELKANEKK